MRCSERIYLFERGWQSLRDYLLRRNKEKMNLNFKVESFAVCRTLQKGNGIEGENGMGGEEQQQTHHRDK